MDSTLVGPHLRLWFIEHDGEISRANAAYESPSDVPTFYHGEHSYSAVTYFPRSQTLHGVLDQTVYIENLPLPNVNHPHLVDPFLHPIPDELESEMNTRQKRTPSGKRKSSEGMQHSSSKRFRGDVQKRMLYPEIFLVVDVSSRRVDPEAEDDYNKALMYVLTYWNAVDMLYRKLRRTDITLNIAGILIGKQQDLRSSGLVEESYIRGSDPHVFILKSTVLQSFGTYFFINRIIFRESFDFLIWMTSATLIDFDAWTQGVNLDRVKKDYSGAAVQADCGGLHQDEIRDHTISNRAVVMYDDDYAQYHVAARGLARLMFVDDDDVVVVHDLHNTNCLPTRPRVESSGIMDPVNKRLDGYLLWSYCSEIHFETYARSESSCCALNYPFRIMGEPDFPHYTSAERQCACYGMRAPAIINYDEDFCSLPLKCENENGRQKEIAMPLDGTPCKPETARIRSWFHCFFRKCP